MANTNIDQLPVQVSLNGTEWVPVQTIGQTTKRAQTALIGQVGLGAALPGAIEFIIDGGGAPISSKLWGDLTVPFNCNLTSAVLLADQVGSIVVDIWRVTFSAFNPPSVPSAANSITGGNPPTITSGVKNQSSLLSWTTSLNQGDILAFNVPSVATNITRVTLGLNLTRVVSN